MTLERIGLSGAGVSHLLATRDGERLGIVARLHDLLAAPC